MTRHDLMRLYFRAQVHLGLTGSEFRGLMWLSGLLLLGVAARELSRRVPAVDQAVYARLEQELRERAAAFPAGELLGPPADAPKPVAAPVATADEPVDLNLASVEQLDSLPRIGPALAARIVAHRERFGPFRSVHDLLMIRGIGDATVEGLRLLVTVRAPPDSLRSVPLR